MLDTVAVVGAVLILALLFGALILPRPTTLGADPAVDSREKLRTEGIDAEPPRSLGQPITANRNGEDHVS